MKITKTPTDDHQLKVTAEFEPELLEQFKHRAARKLAQRTKIPGFRPGKAPYNMILTYLGEATVTREALELMLDDVYPKVLDAEGIKPYGPGNLDNIPSEDPPTFEFTIPLEPEVELEGLDALSKKYEPTVITDEQVQNFIDSMRREQATIVPLETPAAEGNLVFLNLQATDSALPESEEAQLIKPTPQQILIPSNSEERASEWPFKGFARSFIGHKAGETLDFTHDYPEDSENKDFAGKKLHFKVDLQSVKGLELPAVDEEFIKKVSAAEDVPAFEKSVREHLEHEALHEYEDAYYLELVDQLRKQAVIKYPPQMLANEEDQVLHRIEHDLSHRKLDLDLYLKLRKTDRDTFINEEVKPTALNRLERSLIMEALTRQYEIKVGEAEMQEEISRVIDNLIYSGDFEAIQKELGKKKFAESVSMEAANRALEKAIRAQLRKIADPDSVAAVVTEAAANEAEPEKPAAKPRKKAAAPKTEKPAPAAEAEEAKPAKPRKTSKAKAAD